MDERIVETVTGWDSDPFDGGYDGLRSLADREFSGAVTQGTAWLFMLNGRVVGIVDGDMEAFEGTDGTTYTAPDPSLPMLFAMQSTGGDIQGKYYSEDTPMSEVDATLSSGSFTGYIELSENVLSGDYYVVYYGGRRMPCAFVGNSRRLLTEEEAFERADDEVGIYKVHDVDIDVLEIPDDSEETEDAGTAAGSDDQPDAPDAADPGTDTGVDRGDDVDENTDSGDGVGSRASEPGAVTPDRGDGQTVSSEQSDARPASAGAEASTKARDAAPTETDSDGNQFAREEQWRETRAIPSLDPEESGAVIDDGRNGAASAVGPGGVESQPGGDAAVSSDPGTTAAQDPEKLRGQLRKVEQARDEAQRQLQQARARVEDLESEREDLQERNAELKQRVADLESRVEELRGKLAESGDPVGGSAERNLTPTEAIDGTNLFVRYASKSGGTLEKAQEGTINREEVNENLRLEHHTEFEASTTTVDGRSFEEFLTDTTEYRFVEWAVRELPFEISETASEAALGDLYEALPDVDRAELHGTVAVDTEEGPVQREFDVVLRDRLGDPLVVADVNDSREATTATALDGLVEDASTVAGAGEPLAAAVSVTAAYFEPEALEAAADATGGGLLSRDKRKSFVRLSRKRGFHLCLVETRGGGFHINVPDL